MLAVNGGKGSELPSYFVRKTVQAFRRDAALRLRRASRRYVRHKPSYLVGMFVIGAVVLCAIVFSFVLLRKWTRNIDKSETDRDGMFEKEFNHAGLSVKRLDCLCLKHDDGVDFADGVISDARFVARARFLKTSEFFMNDGSIPDEEHGDSGSRILVAEFSIISMLRGPLGVANHRLFVKCTHMLGCAKESSILRPFFPPLADWLIISGALDNASNYIQLGPNVMKPVSFTTELSLPSFCTFSRSSDETNRMDKAVRMFPWHSLPMHVRQHLLVPPAGTASSAATWWRSRTITDPSIVDQKAGLGVGSTGLSVLSWSGGRQWWARDGVSIIAACKNRGETLNQALTSWLKVEAVDEIVLVDWSSSPSLVQLLPDDLVSEPRLSIVRVDGQAGWALTRAYNIALQMASRTAVLKVDCDSWIAPDFVKTHKLYEGIFYAGDWTSLDSGPSNALHSNGILFAIRADLMAIGGYDERIGTYGWDDTDVVTRLGRIRSSKVVHYDKVKHIPHSPNLRVVHQRAQTILSPSHPFAAAVEVQRNRLLLTRYGLPEWGPRSSRTIWNTGSTSVVGNATRTVKVQLQKLTAANEVPTLVELVSTADAVDVAKRSIRLILNRYGVPMLPKSLSVSFYKDYITRVAFPSRFAQLTFYVRGGCVARITALAAIRFLTTTDITLQPREKNYHHGLNASFVHPPEPFESWRVLNVWTPNSECKCQHADLIYSTDEPVITAWGDVSNMPHLNETHSNLRALLMQYSYLARQVNATERVARWLQSGESNRNSSPSQTSLIETILCGLDGLTDESRELVDSFRDSLRTIIPQSGLTTKVASSLEGHSVQLLDMTTFSERSASSVLGTLLTNQIVTIFSSSEIITMATTWSTSSQTGHPISEHSHKTSSRKLENRARGIVFAVAMQELKMRGGLKRPTSRISLVWKVVDRLLFGCRRSRLEILQAFPELAVIIAAMMSSGLCS